MSAGHRGKGIIPSGGNVGEFGTSKTPNEYLIIASHLIYDVVAPESFFPVDGRVEASKNMEGISEP